MVLNLYFFLRCINKYLTIQILKGFKPADVSNYFKNNLISLLDRTLSTAKVEMNQIGLICYTKGPGIGTCLDLVATFAKTIAYLSKLPIVGVNHCVARNFILEKIKNKLVQNSIKIRS